MNIFFGSGIANGGGQILGAAAPPPAIDAFVTAVGTSRIGGIYHVSRNLVASGGNLVTWDDARGASGFGPQLLPNGGTGGTGPTVDANYVITNGTSSYVSNATANNLFSMVNGVAGTLIVVCEPILAGTANYWGGIIDSQVGGQLMLLKNTSSKMSLFGYVNTVPKTFPAAGVRSLIIVSMPKRYAMASADPANGRLVMLDFAGRGFDAEGLTRTNTNGYLSICRYSNQFGVMKIRCLIYMTDVLSVTDRAALETLVTDLTLGDNVSLYTQSDSTGMLMCVGDSRTFGSESSAPSSTVPIATTGSAWTSRLQALITGRGTKLDVCGRGTPSITFADVITPQTGHTTSYFQDLLAMCSPARRAANLIEAIVLSLGTNDIAAGTALATIQGYFTTAATLAHAAGTKIAFWTIPPADGWFGTAAETKRTQLNSWLLSNSAGADLVIDSSQCQDSGTFFFADPVGTDTITTNATYYFQTTRLHFTDLSNTKMGDYFDAQLHAAGLS